jgi:ferric-dicitrate binding protein FerR (iron transport regulator)
MEQSEYNEELIMAYLTGQADADEMKALRAWIDESPDNRRLFRETVNVWQVTHPAFDPNGINLPEAERAILAKIHRHTGLNTALKYWQRIAAIIVIPLALYLFYVIKQANKEDVAEIEYQELKVPFGLLSEINLPDGSKVWLNSSSSLKYPVRFTRVSVREVQLNGEGYFEVTSDKEHPFVVEASGMTVTATGTSFNVEAYETDSLAAVTLVDGSLQVVTGTKSPVAMQIGDRMSYNRNTSKRSILRNGTADGDFYKWYAWKDGIIIFRDDPLSFVFKRLEQIFDVRFIVKNTEICDAPYRATFRNEPLERILRLLEMSAKIKFTYKERTFSNNIPEKQEIIVEVKK